MEDPQVFLDLTILKIQKSKTIFHEPFKISASSKKHQNHGSNDVTSDSDSDSEYNRQKTKPGKTQKADAKLNENVSDSATSFQASKDSDENINGK